MMNSKQYAVLLGLVLSVSLYGMSGRVEHNLSRVLKLSQRHRGLATSVWAHQLPIAYRVSRYDLGKILPSVQGPLRRLLDNAYHG